MIGKFLDFVQRGTTIVTASFLLLITVMMVFEVVGRYFAGFTLGFSSTLITIMTGWGVYLLIGSVARRDQHVKIGFFIEWVLGRRRAKPVYETVENVFSLGMCCFLIYAGYLLIASYMRAGTEAVFMPTETGSIDYPAWINLIAIPLGFFIAMLFYLERIGKQIRSLRHRGQGDQRAESEEVRG